jgi:hypothetical protein
MHSNFITVIIIIDYALCNFHFFVNGSRLDSLNNIHT